MFQPTGSLIGAGAREKAYACIFEDDFINPNVTDEAHGTAGVESGGYAFDATADAIPTEADIQDEALGVFRLTSGATETNYSSMLTIAEWLLPTAGKSMVFKCRLDLDEATQSVAFIGVVDTATGDFNAGLQDGLYFRKDDGDTNWDFVVEDGTSETANTAIATAAANTMIELAFEVQYAGANSGKVWVYVNGDRVLSRSYASGLPNSLMGLGACIEAGDGNARQLNIDYWAVAIER